MDKGNTIHELSRNPVSPRTREDLRITMESITTMEEFHIINGSTNGNGSGASSQNRSNPTTPAKNYLSHITCFKCGKTGHYATECSEAKNVNGNGSSGKKPNPFNKG